MIYYIYIFPSLSGSLSDPPNIAGLSHFCEHMLFLGTKKYPKENEYSQFLSEHAGSSNAFTSGEHTNYYFDVSHEHLEGALDTDSLRPALRLGGQQPLGNAALGALFA